MQHWLSATSIVIAARSTNGIQVTRVTSFTQIAGRAGSPRLVLRGSSGGPLRDPPLRPSTAAVSPRTLLYLYIPLAAARGVTLSLIVRSYHVWLPPPWYHVSPDTNPPKYEGWSSEGYDPRLCVDLSLEPQVLERCGRDAPRARTPDKYRL